MSITPVDKPPDGDDEPDGALSRRSSVLRACVGRLVTWLGARVAEAGLGSDGQDATRSARTAASDGGSDVEATPVEPADCPAFEDFPEREQPLTHPARNLPGINTPDVVCIETEDGLRLSIPENPDAELTSDVWMPVEP